MFVINKLKKIIFENSADLTFDIPFENQEKYINSFPEPVDCIERSFYQYKCQHLKKNTFQLFFLNLISAILLPFSIFMLYLKGLFLKSNIIENDEKNIAIYPYGGMYRSIIPETFEKKYTVIECQNGKFFGIFNRDLLFISKLLVRYPLRFYYILRIVYKLAQYSALINLYKPKAILTSSEYTFTSTAMTEYCRVINVKHINIMHGEKFYSLVDTFFEFDECSVWDEFYKDLFISLRAQPQQFVINRPETLSLNLNTEKLPVHYLTYYLGGENKDELQKIKKCLEKYLNSNKNVCIRPHPRYSNPQEIKEIFGNKFNIEKTNVSLKESFENTNYVVSFFSTILYQAFLNDKKIVIDDVSKSIKDLQQLKDLKYIILSKDHLKLSQL